MNLDIGAWHMSMTEREFNISLGNTLENYLIESDPRDAHHQEMMRLIDHLNEIKLADFRSRSF